MGQHFLWENLWTPSEFSSNGRQGKAWVKRTSQTIFKNADLEVRRPMNDPV